MVNWRNGSAVSQDGTTITFLSMGEGPGIVVLPGNNRRAYHYAKLAKRCKSNAL
jgi:hypothetical protein